MDPIHVLILALLQGVAELFPISSLGHTVIIPGLLGWNETLQSPTFLPLVVALHLGTAVALLTFFWRDWVELIGAGAKVVLAGKFTPDVDPKGYGRQLVLVVVGTVPAGLIGVFLQKPLESLFSQPILASAFLVANGAVLLTAERLWQSRQKQAQRRPAVRLVSYSYEDTTIPRSAAIPPGEIGKSINEMSFGQAMLIGLGQSFALLPGISRSGSTMVAGMLSGLSHEASARFSFLLATPIIFGAGVLELPKLVSAGHKALLLAGIGGVVAGVAAYLSVRFLMRYFETNKLDPFAWYCIGAGLLSFGYFFLVALKIIP